jgi:Protein of unknown function (DUF2889)
MTAATTNSFATDSILPPDPDGLEVLHDREYRVRAYRAADDRLLIRGAVRDQKPPGMYVDGDPDPLTVHHMQVELEVAFPSLEITRAHATLEIHPNASCPRIEDHYGELVGLSIARGFTNRVRELFGGPRGCTHTTALIQAMAPVAVQCFWSMRASTARREGLDVPFQPPDAEHREEAWRLNVGSCHVWAEDGEQVAKLRSGGEMDVPVWMQVRLRSLGRDPKDWIRGAQGRG